MLFSISTTCLLETVNNCFIDLFIIYCTKKVNFSYPTYDINLVTVFRKFLENKFIGGGEEEGGKEGTCELKKIITLKLFRAQCLLPLEKPLMFAGSSYVL